MVLLLLNIKNHFFSKPNLFPLKRLVLFLDLFQKKSDFDNFFRKHTVFHLITKGFYMFQRKSMLIKNSIFNCKFIKLIYVFCEKLDLPLTAVFEIGKNELVLKINHQQRVTKYFPNCLVFLLKRFQKGFQIDQTPPEYSLKLPGVPSETLPKKGSKSIKTSPEYSPKLPGVPSETLPERVPNRSKHSIKFGKQYIFTVCFCRNLDKESFFTFFQQTQRNMILQ